jgi:hypothetical protein
MNEPIVVWVCLDGAERCAAKRIVLYSLPRVGDPLKVLPHWQWYPEVSSVHQNEAGNEYLISCRCYDRKYTWPDGTVSDVPPSMQRTGEWTTVDVIPNPDDEKRLEVLISKEGWRSVALNEPFPPGAWRRAARCEPLVAG